MPSNHSFSVVSSSWLQSFPASRSFLMNQLFTSGGHSIGASATASILPVNIQDWFIWDWLVWSLCSSRDSQESSPTPQFKRINSSALSLLYGPTLSSIHDHWKNRQFSSVQWLNHVRIFAAPWKGSMPGFPVHHQLPELAQTHVHQVSDAIQPCHPLSSPSPPAFNLSKHQGLF